MNYFDYILVITILISMSFGFIRGGIATSLSLIGWILTVILTYKFYPHIEVLLSEHIKTKSVIVIVGNLLLIASLLLLFYIINTLIQRLFKEEKSISMRALGVVVGVLRGVLFVLFLFFCYSISLKILAGSSDLKEKEFPQGILDSKSYGVLTHSSELIESMLPDDIQKQLKEIYQNEKKNEFDMKLVRHYVNVLKVYATHDEINHINIMRQDLLSMGQKDVIDIKTLEYLFGIYNKKKNNDQLPATPLEQSQIAKIDNLIDEYYLVKS